MDPALTVDWFKQRTGYYRKPEMQAAGERAEVLHMRAKDYCAEAETGGYVPASVLPMLTPVGWKQRVAALVAVGLWERTQAGYRIVDWEEDQAELEAYAARKRSDRERKRAQRERDKQAAQSEPSQDQSEDKSRDRSRDSHGNVRTQEKEKEKKTTSSSPPRDRGDGQPDAEPDPEAETRDKTAREVLGWWWDQLETKPAGKRAWHASLRVINNLLSVGHEPKAVAAAARTIGTPLTTARMEIELGRMRTAAANGNARSGGGVQPSRNMQILDAAEARLDAMEAAANSNALIVQGEAW